MHIGYMCVMFNFFKPQNGLFSDLNERKKNLDFNEVSNLVPLLL